MGNRADKLRDDVIQRELDLIYNEFNIGELGRTRESFEGLRYSANDLESVERKVMEDLTGNTDIDSGEESEELHDLVKIVIYKYYLLMHTVEEYLQTGEFGGLNSTFEDIWSRLALEDKCEVITMEIITEDSLAMVYGVYILLAQLERKG